MFKLRFACSDNFFKAESMGSGTLQNSDPTSMGSVLDWHTPVLDWHTPDPTET